MKGYDNWNHRPYYPANQLSGSINPYICRLAPGKDHCEIEWLGDGESFQLQYSEREKNSWNAIAVEGHEYLLEGLEENTEYELLLTDSNHRNSNIRLLRTGSKVGIIVNYLHPEDKQYGFQGSIYAVHPCCSCLTELFWLPWMYLPQTRLKILLCCSGLMTTASIGTMSQIFFPASGEKCSGIRINSLCWVFHGNTEIY